MNTEAKNMGTEANKLVKKINTETNQLANNINIEANNLPRIWTHKQAKK